jgi:hypothetical protein
MKPSSCPDCNARFGLLRWRRTCGVCRETRCAACLVGTTLPTWAWPGPIGRVCRRCHDERVAPLERSYSAALARRIDVIAYLGRYRGEPEVDPSSRRPIESGFHREKDDAVRELQTMAAFHGLELIEELEFQSGSSREAFSRPGEDPVPFGEEERRNWKATGIAGAFERPSETGATDGD